MKALPRRSTTDLTLDISWQKHGISHQERFFAGNFNCWRDVFPGSVFEKVLESNPLDRFSVESGPKDPVAEHHPRNVMDLPLSRLNGSCPGRVKQGRFYPRGWLSGVPAVFKGNMEPFRCTQVDANRFTADLNHPMAGIPLQLDVRVGTFRSDREERGGSCTDWLDLALSGPGMQARQQNLPTDFFSGHPFARRDERLDDIFYRTDRFVDHIDQKAQETLSGLYARLLKPGDVVLDLMAGWKSHIPEDLELDTLHGLGLNPRELEQNSRLTSLDVFDLNRDLDLPFRPASFDAVICSMSVEYLANPFFVFRQVAGILKPGGMFCVAFSNRWFPEKTIRIWEDLHEFERMGLVSEYFLESGLYEKISTFSARGYPRPVTDRYFPGLTFSDPVYAVMGLRKGGGDGPENTL